MGATGEWAPSPQSRLPLCSCSEGNEPPAGGGERIKSLKGVNFHSSWSSIPLGRGGGHGAATIHPLTFWMRLAFSAQLSSSRRSFSLSRWSLSFSLRTASARARRLPADTAWALTSASTPAGPSAPGHSGRKAAGTGVGSTLRGARTGCQGLAGWESWLQLQRPIKHALLTPGHLEGGGRACPGF